MCGGRQVWRPPRPSLKCAACSAGALDLAGKSPASKLRPAIRMVSEGKAGLPGFLSALAHPAPGNPPRGTAIVIIGGPSVPTATRPSLTAMIFPASALSLDSTFLLSLARS